MGSCENLVKVNENSSTPITEEHLRSEPLVQSVSKQDSCSEMARSDKEFTSVSYVFSDLSGNNNGGNSKSNNVTWRSYDMGGLVGEHEGASVLSIKNSGKNECGFSGDCLNENQSDIGNVESQSDCLKGGCTGRVGGLTYISGNCFIPSLIQTMAVLPSRSVQQDEQNGNEKVLVEVVKDKGDDSAHKKTILCAKVSSSQSGEISSEIVLGGGRMISKAVALARSYTDPCEKVSISRAFEKSSELVSGDSETLLKTVTVNSSSSSNVQEDELKHNDSLNSVSCKIVAEVAEEKGDVLAQKKTDFCEKGSSLQGCEMISVFVSGEPQILLQLVPETGSQRGDVHQDQQKDDKSVNYLSSKMTLGIVEDESDFLAHNNIDLCKKASSLQGCEKEVIFSDCETSLDIATVTFSPKNCAQKDNENMNCLFPKVVGKVLEEKVCSFAEESADLCEKVSSLQGSEISSKMESVNGVLGNSVEPKEQNSERVGIPTISDVSGWLESNGCNRISFIQNGEMSIQASNVVEEVIDCGRKIDKRVNNGQQNQACEEILKIVHMPESPSSQVKQNEQVNDKSTVTVERFTESMEDKSDVVDVVKVESMTEMLPLEESAHNLTKGFSRVITPKIEKLIMAQPCESVGLDVPHQFRSGPSSINSSQACDFSGQMYFEGKDGVRFDRAPETQCCGTVSLSSQRSSKSGKSNRMIQTKKETKKCRNTAKVSCNNEDTDNILNAARKKRTCQSKRARLSIWGTLGNVSELFKQGDGHEVTQAQNEGSLKQKSSQKNGKNNKSQATSSTLGCQRKCPASTNCLRLKVKVGKELSQSCFNIPEVIDVSAVAASARRDYGIDMCLGNKLGSLQLVDGVGDELRKSESADFLECFGKDQKNKTSTDLVADKLAGGLRDNFSGVPSHTVVEAPEACESRSRDPGTSPDSEVINLTPDTHVDFRPHQDLTGSKKAKKKSKFSGADNCILGSQSPNPVGKKKAKSSKRQGQKQNMRDGLNYIETLTSSISLNASSNSSSDKEQSKGPLCFSGEGEFAVSVETCNGDSGAKGKVESNPTSQNSQDFLPDAIIKGRKIPKGKSKACDSGNKRATKHKLKEFLKKSGNKKKTHGKAGFHENACKLETQPETGNHIIDGNGKTSFGEHVGHIDIPNMDAKTGGLMEHYLPPRSAWVRCDDCHKWRRITAELADFIEENKCSWICKDNVDKAFASCGIRQEKSNADINAELEISDASGEEEAPGPQSNHKGLEYSCPTVSQQTVIHIISNQFLHRSRKSQTIDEIMVCHCKPPSNGRLGCGDDCLNRMLNIECVRGACPCGDLCSNQQFQKRRYAKLEPFRCGKKGCGLKLLEDISQGHFLIEYVGEVLDMHAYEARQKEYALKGHKHFYFMTLNGSEVIDACIKGNLGRFINHSCEPNCRTEKWMVNGEICIGLFALRDIKKGEEVTFDYNYVRVFGAAVKKCYCGSPRCQGYIGGDPLNTEIVIQSDSDEEQPEPILLPEDGKTEDLNVMPRTSLSSSEVAHTADSIFVNSDEKDKSITAGGELGVSIEKVNAINQSTPATSLIQKTPELEDSMGNLPSVQFPKTSKQTEDVAPTPSSVILQDISVEEGTTEKASSSIQLLGITSPSKIPFSASSANVVNGCRKSKVDVSDKGISSKAHPRVKTSRSSNSVKKKNVKSNPPDPIKVGVTTNKASELSSKPKKLVNGFSHVHFDAVEENLNELLDADGGISKRKDAPKGYLKLLVLTAASGDSSNGAIQSNRDLSMILDALLKTKSRMVLTDIINKNGLRMLHKMMKQYRTDFKKRPILRKLLKVLEYLATREILTMEHITGGPPCPGMESFRFSILSLTDHEDKQVHQIARNFRDRWIPRSLRKPNFINRDDRKSEFHRSSGCNSFSPLNNNCHDQGGKPTEAIECFKQSVPATTLGHVGAQESCSAPCVGGSSTSEKTRKRKSRWDQPADANPDSITLQSNEQKLDSGSLKQFESSPLPGFRKDFLVNRSSRENKNCVGCVGDHCLHNEAMVACAGGQNIFVDVQPGFSSSLQHSVKSSVATSTVSHSVCPIDQVIGHPEEKFVSRLPVSYGIPLSIIQQFGTPDTETLGSWVVAPGMPFHPFPPLPGFCHPSPSLAVSHVLTNQASEGQHNGHSLVSSLSEESTLSTSGDQRVTNISCTSNQYKYKRERESSNDLGASYFKQQKPNI